MWWRFYLVFVVLCKLTVGEWVNCPMPEMKILAIPCKCLFEDLQILIVNCTNTRLNDDYVLSNLIVTAANLNRLIFTGNNVQTLSKNFLGSCGVGSQSSALTSLTYMDLSNNNIKVIQGKTFHCTPKLRELRLSNNDWILDGHTNRVFSSLPQLQILYLDGALSSQSVSSLESTQLLDEIFYNSFSYEITELHLENNQLTDIVEPIFCDLTKLKKLYLSRNRLWKFQLRCLNQVEELYMDYNDISYFDPNNVAALNKLSGLTVLDLSGNPFECDDCLVEFLTWLRGSPLNDTIVNLDHMICSRPEAMAGVKVKDVDENKLEATCHQYGISTENSSGHRVVTITLSVLFVMIAITVALVVLLYKGKAKSKLGVWATSCKQTLARRFHYGYATMHSDKENLTMENV